VSALRRSDASNFPSPRGGRVAGAARQALPAAAILSCLAVLSGCAPEPAEPPPPPSGAIPAGQSIGSAALEGRVVLEGTPPPRRPIRMSGEAACHRPGAEVLSEDVIVSPEGGLKNVYVHILSGLGGRVFAPPAAHALMDQAGCAFVPHVLDVQANQVIDFANSDPVVHNVRAIGEKNRVFNVSMPGKGKTIHRYFSTPEVVKIRCDIHAWMSAFIPVESHPFHRVTGDDGTFTLEGLPAGEYVIEAWHEKLGSRRQSVQLSEGETRTIDFTFPGRPGP
jgi:plastocyanin